MRLIDASALRKGIETDRDASDMPKMWYVGIEYAINHIVHAPTVDAVEVVRCKECKHFDSEDDCDCPMDVRYSDFFCKMGERRTDEEIIHQYHERQKEVLKEMSMPVGRNVMDALRERRTDE